MAAEPGDAADDELVVLIARGDRAAFERLYARLLPIAWRNALRWCGNAAEAEELLQDTFLDVWQRAHTFEPGRGHAVAWLITRLRSRALDRHAASLRRGRAHWRAELFPEQPPPADDLLASLRAQAALRKDLAELPEHQREAIELAYFQGMSASRSAAALQVPEGTVKTRLRLGVARLAARMRGR